MTIVIDTPSESDHEECGSVWALVSRTGNGKTGMNPQTLISA